MKTDAVIIGGGVAGLSCSRELSRLGIASTIVEKAPFPGGHVSHYCCKATDRCQRCGACLLEDVLDYVGSSERITCMLGATISHAERRDGLLSLTVTEQPARIYSDRCNLCGECLDVCPVSGALARSPVDNRIYVNTEACLYVKDRSCRRCEEVCREGAVRLDEAPSEQRIDTASVVVAAGFRPFDASEKPRFGYGLIPGVITSLELDQLLRTDNFTPVGRDRQIRSVAFIQCVGSRDAKIGRNYCSRVCCGYALRLARLLRNRFPGIEPSMFYMDIQTFDRDFERRLEEARREVRLIRSIPAEVRSSDDGRPQLIYQGMDEERMIESFDLVVLSVGISPDPTLHALDELLHIGVNRDGFLGGDEEEVRTDSSGVFIAGAVQGPKSIEQTVFHAIRTAGHVAAYVRRAEERENH
ncbi:MAG: FAD-dependent oxidoreductase [Deltaproteobacteria bacterium]